MATENKRVRRIQVSESEWNSSTPDERVFYVIDLTDGFDVGFKNTSGTKKRLLGGASFNQSGDLVCSDFESTSVIDDGTTIEFSSPVESSDLITIFNSGLTTEHLQMGGNDSNGGFVILKDDAGTTQGIARGYSISDTQMYLNNGGFALGKTTVTSGSVLSVVGAVDFTGGLTIDALAGVGTRAIAVDANGKLVIL